MDSHRNPSLAVDCVIFYKDTDNIILIERKNPPLGLALPGGFVNVGESLQTAIHREVREELGIEVFLHEQFYTYSQPGRDPRQHVVSTVFIGSTTETPVAGDDAANWYLRHIRAAISDVGKTEKQRLAFDHKQIISDVERYINGDGRRPRLS